MTNPCTRRRWAALPVAAVLTMLAAAIAAPAQTFTVLHSFDLTDGAGPEAALVQATDGNLYGTAYEGGVKGWGTVFKITPSGSLTTLYNFCSQSNCADGIFPKTAPVQSTDGSFYGTTASGGGSGCFGAGNGCGTIFRITSSGKLTALYSFCPQGSNCQDGAHPFFGGLLQSTDGNFYGTTWDGGVSNTDCPFGCGTVFKITNRGVLTTLYDFCVQSGCTDGSFPSAGLVQGLDGNFYGTTEAGGAYANCAVDGQVGCGTVFKISPTGTLTTLRSFDSTDGAGPQAVLIQATDGNLYGTTRLGGPNNDGTVFRITQNGMLTTLYSFCTQSGCTDGSDPIGALVQATDGNFYGTTAVGGANNSCYFGLGCGTVFKITPGGTLTMLYSFCSQSGCTDGNDPYGGLVQSTNGNFYGTTQAGGNNTACPGTGGGCGTVFGLSAGLRPFVKTAPTSGKVGISAAILGTKLTGATSVTFNGTPAAFTVVSATAIKTTVPADATTGPIQVVTPSGTLTSNVNFQVEP